MLRINERWVPEIAGDAVYLPPVAVLVFVYNLMYTGKWLHELRYAILYGSAVRDPCVAWKLTLLNSPELPEYYSYAVATKRVRAPRGLFDRCEASTRVRTSTFISL